MALKDRQIILASVPLGKLMFLKLKSLVFALLSSSLNRILVEIFSTNLSRFHVHLGDFLWSRNHSCLPIRTPSYQAKDCYDRSILS